MEKTNSLGKVFCYQKIWIVAWAGDAWFKVSYNSFAKVTRQKGPPAESSSLQKAAYKSPLVRTSFHFYGMMDEGGFPGGASGKESACQGFPGGLVKWSHSVVSYSLQPHGR